MSYELYPQEAFRLTDPEFFASAGPHRLWAELRRSEPVIWTTEEDGPGFWSVTTYRECQEILRKPGTFSSEAGTVITDSRWRRDPAGGRMLGLMDPPRHTQLRRELNRAFVRQRLVSLEPVVRSIVRRLVDEQSRGAFDFASALAAILPAEVFFSIIGIPRVDWADIASAVLRSACFGGSEQREAHAELLLYFDDFVRVEQPASELLRTLFNVGVDGEALPHEDVVVNVYNFTLASVNTTRLALTGGVQALAEHPKAWEQIKNDRGICGTAAEEIIRWTSPALVFLRTARHDHRLGRVLVRAGQQVAVWLPSANRDEKHFHAADAFDAMRRPNAHLGFGSGPHACIGAALARLEVRVFLEEIASQWELIQLSGEPRRMRSLQLFGIESLPISVSLSR